MMMGMVRVVDEFVRHGLEEHFRAQVHPGALDAHAGGDVEQRGREAPHLHGEGLASQVFHLFGREGAAVSHQAAQRARFLAGNEIVFLQETVSSGQHGADVTIGLHGQQHDGHAEEVGQEKAGQLADADVSAQEFPYQSVHWV